MMHNGLNLSDAIVKEMGTSGEHDGVADLVENEAECDEVGQVSVEIKCQRLCSEQGKTNVRKVLRKEEVEECICWQRALGKRGAEWVGRPILLVCIDQSGNVSSKAEWKPVQAGWRVLWGWNSVHIDPPRVNLVRHAAPKTAVAPKAVPAPKARSSPKSKPFPTYQYRKAQNYWRRIDSLPMWTSCPHIVENELASQGEMFREQRRHGLISALTLRTVFIPVKCSKSIESLLKGVARSNGWQQALL